MDWGHQLPRLFPASGLGDVTLGFAIGLCSLLLLLLVSATIFPD
jgi:hypothetical protein